MALTPDQLELLQKCDGIHSNLPDLFDCESCQTLFPLPPAPANIRYYTKHVYGQSLNYIAHTGQASCWHSITGKKTITDTEMTLLTNLTGCTFERIFEPKE